MRGTAVVGVSVPLARFQLPDPREGMEVCTFTFMEQGGV